MASKRLIICCDGTWNQPFQDGGATNVAKTVRAICPVDASDTPQVVYYDPGVGTGNFIDRLLGGGMGIGLSQNVQDAYLFLVSNFHEGDQIFLFGFSRGAYTVRSLAGLIGVVGILQKKDIGRFPEAYRYYRTPSDERSGELAARLLPRERKLANIDFLGVWDTVGSMGIPLGPLRFIALRRFGFHDVRLGERVKHAYHALAIDERRRSFEPSIWNHVPKPEVQDVVQAWFAGAHSNVGGGYPNTGLSDAAWGWILGKARKCGLYLDDEFVAELTRANPPSVLYDSRQSWKWKFRRPLDRQVFAVHPATERLHSSVLARMGMSDGQIIPGSYSPPNVVGLQSKLEAEGKRLEDYLVD